MSDPDDDMLPSGRRFTNGNRATFERYVQTSIQVLLVAVLLWAGSALNELQKLTAASTIQIANIAARLDRLELRIEKVDERVTGIKETQQRDLRVR